MKDLSGKIEHAGETYAWWAGNANPNADDEYAVHCRHKHVGITEYTNEAPTQEKAEEVARKLAPKVDQLR